MYCGTPTFWLGGLWDSCFQNPSESSAVVRVTIPYRNLLVKPRIFQFSGKYMTLCILQGIYVGKKKKKLKFSCRKHMYFLFIRPTLCIVNGLKC